MGEQVAYLRKLIEVALPLEAINKASARESFIYRGNPSAIHKWWAQRPLAAARAVIFAQMVDDPSADPERLPTKEAQQQERQRLFRLIEALVQWESTTDETVLSQARAEIWRSWRATCAANRSHPRAAELFNPGKLPTFHDPFSGGGSLPLEAQRLGFESHASDLNPVSVLICKAVSEIPPKFAEQTPVNPEVRREESLIAKSWRGADGLAEDVRFYGRWMRAEAQQRIGHLYPKVEVTPAMAQARPDLKSLVGQELQPIAWLWARTVKSPNPALAKVDVPLATTFMLSTKPGKESYIEPVVEGSSYRFTVRVGKRKGMDSAKNGTKLSGANFRCLLSGVPIPADYIRAQGQAGRMGATMLALVAEGERGRVYLAPTPEMEAVARNAEPAWKPEVEFFQQALGFRIGNYGLTKWSDLFAPRQLVALTTLSDLVQEAREQVKRDALAASVPNDERGLATGGTGAQAYADAVATYLAFSLDKTAEYGCTIVPWYTKEDRPGHAFSRQAIPMVWDYAEVNPLADIGGSFSASVRIVAGALSGCHAAGIAAQVKQLDAVAAGSGTPSLISTDPPYYDNVGYADLSDFFYVWLRRSLKPIFPDLFATLGTPKAEELVATPARHGGKDGAEAFFLRGMKRAMDRLVKQAHPALPVTIYYAFKQSETESGGTSSTGWETFLDAVTRAGFAISGTWPMRTERSNRSRGIDSNALASSIVLVCRPRSTEAPTATRRELLAGLKAELPVALAHLQQGNIAPVDLAQAAIGPGMAVYTRYAEVLDAEGKALSVRQALALINQTLDEVLAEQEGDFDPDSRWALAWFEESGFAAGRVRCGRDALQGQEHERRGHGRSGHHRFQGWQGTSAQPGSCRRTGSRPSTSASRRGRLCTS